MGLGGIANIWRREWRKKKLFNVFVGCRHSSLSQWLYSIFLIFIYKRNHLHFFSFPFVLFADEVALLIHFSFARHLNSEIPKHFDLDGYIITMYKYCRELETRKSRRQTQPSTHIDDANANTQYVHIVQSKGKHWNVWTRTGMWGVSFIYVISLWRSSRSAGMHRNSITSHSMRKKNHFFWHFADIITVSRYTSFVATVLCVGSASGEDIEFIYISFFRRIYYSFDVNECKNELCKREIVMAPIRLWMPNMDAGAKMHAK